MATQAELVYTHLTGWSSINLQGLSLGPVALQPPVLPSHRLRLESPAKLCPSCVTVGGHTRAAQDWHFFPAEELPSPQKLHLNLGTWQASKRLVGDNV